VLRAVGELRIQGTSTSYRHVNFLSASGKVIANADSQAYV
jgi:hypothetical protein